MIYLKIFHKHFLFILLLLLSGCISSPDNEYFDEVINENQVEKIEDDIFPEENSIAVTVDSDETEISVEIIEWMVPEEEKLSSEIYLPKVVEKIIIIDDPEITETVYISSYTDNYEYYWDYKPKITVVEKVETNLEIKNIPENINNNPVEKNEENITKIITEQAISATVSNKLDILLEGRGWIYLPDDANSSVEYSGRKFTDEHTIYTFVPKNIGNYILRFQYQNLSSNIFNVEEVDLSIVKLKEVNHNNIDTLLPSADNADLKEVEIFDLESVVNQMIIDKDGSGLAVLVPELLDSKISSVINKLPEIAELLYNKSFLVLSASILENLIFDNSLTMEKDYFLYLLGNIYEKESSLRNEQKSAEYYKKLIDSYPSSIYWEDSEDRFRFLKRRYIDIR